MNKSTKSVPRIPRDFFLHQTDQELIWHPFDLPYSKNILIKKAKGVYLFDDQHKKYLDAVSSWWVNLHGHGNLKLKNALNKQFRNTDHVIFSGFTHEPAIRLAKHLIHRTGNRFGKVFYSDNGSTSVEVALKMAIHYLTSQKKEKIGLLSFKNAYHGDTFGAMAAGGKNLFNTVYEKYLFGVEQIPLPNDSNLNDTLSRITQQQKRYDALIFIYEPLIQGAGGMNIYSEKHLAAILKTVKQKESVCIADEVMTGFYRTGRFTATDKVVDFDPLAQPDILCLSKGITGGVMPLGATLVSEQFVKVFKDKPVSERFYHGHSYTGNPLACAVALENLKLLNKSCKKNIDRIESLHQQFAVDLQKRKEVKNTGVCGTILRFEVLGDEKTGYGNNLRDKIYNYFLEKGILLRPLGNVIYIMPPYVITDKELKYIYKTIEEFLDSKQKSKRAAN